MNMYFGIFSDLYTLFKEDIKEISMYEKCHGQIYDLAVASEEEVQFYVEELLECGKEILELCCGNGRLTIPLAKNGFKITGIERSQDMLNILNDKKMKLNISRAKNISYHNDDIFMASFDKKFDAIILPACTISILSDDTKKIQQLFSKLSNYLTKDGKFILDFENDENINSKKKSEMMMYSYKGKDYKQFTLVQEFKNFNHGRNVSNFFTQKEYVSGTIERFITCNDKRMITLKNIHDFIKDSNFYVFKVENKNFNGTNINSVTLRLK